MQECWFLFLKLILIYEVVIRQARVLKDLLFILLAGNYLSLGEVLRSLRAHWVTFRLVKI